jgi:uncharacterized protein (DUF924 family)
MPGGGSEISIGIWIGRGGIIVRELLRGTHFYWFGALTSPGSCRSDTGELWFRQSAETDRYISEAYGTFIAEAAGRDWDLSGLSREEGVALVVMFDQFPRNIFRSSGKQFEFDARAREIIPAVIKIDR